VAIWSNWQKQTNYKESDTAGRPFVDQFSVHAIQWRRKEIDNGIVLICGSGI